MEFQYHFLYTSLITASKPYKMHFLQKQPSRAVTIKPEIPTSSFSIGENNCFPISERDKSLLDLTTRHSNIVIISFKSQSPHYKGDEQNKFR